MTKLSEVRIKQQCRDTHGYEKAYDLASEHIKTYYKIFASKTHTDHKTFVLTLSFEKPDTRDHVLNPEEGRKLLIDLAQQTFHHSDESAKPIVDEFIKDHPQILKFYNEDFLYEV